MKVLTIGGAMRDIFIQYPCTNMVRFQEERTIQSFVLLPEGKKLTVDNLINKTGGGATNTAVSFARLGFTTSCFSKIGDDEQGTIILDELKHEKVNTNHILRTESAATGTSFIMPCSAGERTVLVYRGANLTLTQQELPINLLAQYDLVYITSMSGPTAPLLLPLVHAAKKQKKLVATNPGTSQLVAGAQYLWDALPYIDILILNTYEATLLMHSLLQKTHIKKDLPGEKNLPTLLQQGSLIKESSLDLLSFFHQVRQHGPQTVVVTNGAEGVYAAHEKELYFHPSLKTPVISTLGAGDAFGSCFTAQLAQEKPIEYAICAGVSNSASVLQHIGAKMGLLYQTELEKQIKTIDQHLLQEFPFSAK